MLRSNRLRLELGDSMTDIIMTEADLGCHLDNHRGHYIGRDAIQLAQGYGFIVGPFEQWAIDTYDDS